VACLENSAYPLVWSTVRHGLPDDAWARVHVGYEPTFPPLQSIREAAASPHEDDLIELWKKD
jgi:hypothetical protein